MEKNVGGLDRKVRIGGGAILIVLTYLWLAGIPRIIAALIGIYYTITGVTGYCLINKTFKIDTTKR